MLGRFRIGQKLALLVAIPLTLSTVASSAIAVEARRAAQDAHELTETVGLFGPTLELLKAVRGEQDTLVLGLDSAPYQAASARLDKAFDTLSALPNLDNFGPGFASALSQSRKNLLEIRTQMRSFGDDVKRMMTDQTFITTPRGGQIGNTITSYTPQITRLIVSAMHVTARDVPKADELMRIQAVQQILELDELIGDESLAAGFAIESWEAKDLLFVRLLASTVARSFTGTDNAIAAIRKNAGTDATRQFEAVMATEGAKKLLAVRETMSLYYGTPQGAGTARPVDRMELNDLYTEMSQKTTSLLNASTADLVGRAQASARSADNRATSMTLGALASLALVVLLTLAIYRSVAVPVRTLTRRTTEIADSELPAMMSALRELGANDQIPAPPSIEVKSRDEVADLVRSFNSLQATTMELAAAQARSRRNVAEMFVNLGRRNQKLISRQLALLDEYQKEEVDPRKLSELYAVDQIATRMRRNAESLLVLAGTVPPRQFAKPVAVGNVLRAALAEVEGFQRVRIDGSFDDVTVNGNAVADVTHLIAEVLENALRFSPEDSMVQVMTRATESRCIVHISDTGMGISPDSLAELIRSFAAAATSDDVPTRQLGLFVVSKLAARHGIDVTFHEGALGGLTVRISLPTSVVNVVIGPAQRNWHVGDAPVRPEAPKAAVPATTMQRERLKTATPQHVVTESDVDAAVAGTVLSAGIASSAGAGEASGFVRRTRKTQRVAEELTMAEPVAVPSVAPEMVAHTLAGFVGGFRRSATLNTQENNDVQP
jgi:signal transduction histidine kinase